MKAGDGKGKEGSFLPSFLPHPARLLTCPIFHMVFDPRSSFIALKVHGNACHTGYTGSNTNIHAIELSNVESLQLSLRVNQH